MSVKQRFASCWHEGRKAEDDFCIWAESKGFLVEKAPNEMQFKHIDFYLTNPDGIKRSVDVKSRKRLSRTGEVQDAVIWVEFKNVQGKDGWLLSPHLDYLAFQKEEDIDFMLVKREKLLDLCLNVCSMTENAANSKDALYKKYTRRDRPNEHTSCILLSDVLTIEHKIP